MQLSTNPMGSNPDSTVAKIEKKSFYVNPQLKETNELSTLHDKTYVFYDTWSYILLAAPGDDTVFKREDENYKPSTPQGVVFAIRSACFLQTLLAQQTLSAQLGQFSSVEFSSVLLFDYM